MATLYIFGDESGTMPVNDADKPFVAATIAVLGKPPVLVPGSNDVKRMVDIFANFNLIPFAAVVKPYPGYGRILKAKYEKIKIMAQATRIVSGGQATYLDEKTRKDGFDLRNTVWSHAMSQSIANAVLNTLFTGSIDSIQIILDQKTMTPSMRQFFKEMIINRIGDGMKQFLKSIYFLSPTIVSEWEKRAHFSSKTTVISWSDESEELEEEFGLRLVDRFARKIYQAQIKPNSDIEEIFMKAGFEELIHDISRLLTRLDKGLIDHFRQVTGLPEPQLV